MTMTAAEQQVILSFKDRMTFNYLDLFFPSVISLYLPAVLFLFLTDAQNEDYILSHFLSSVCLDTKFLFLFYK